MSNFFHTEDRLIGELVSELTKTQTTTFRIRFTDRITGEARTPDASTRLFTVDKGDVNNPNPKYESVYAPNGFTVNAVGDITLDSTGLIRGLPRNLGEWTGTDPFVAVTANQQSHTEGAEVGVAVSHFLHTILAETFAGNKSTGNSIFIIGDDTAADQTLEFGTDHTTNPTIFWDDSAGRHRLFWGDDAAAVTVVDGVGVAQLTTTERDARTWPSGGVVIYNTSLGQTQFREGNAWVTNSVGSTVADASTTVAGKVEEGTVAEQGTATATGGSGARLFTAVANLVKTSSGAGDENKLALLDASGEWAAGFIGKATLKSTLTTKGDIYAATAASTPARRSIGADDTVLTADASESTGMKWAAIPILEFISSVLAVTIGNSGTIPAGANRAFVNLTTDKHTVTGGDDTFGQVLIDADLTAGKVGSVGNGNLRTITATWNAGGGTVDITGDNGTDDNADIFFYK